MNNVDRLERLVARLEATVSKQLEASQALRAGSKEPASERVTWAQLVVGVLLTATIAWVASYVTGQTGVRDRLTSVEYKIGTLLDNFRDFDTRLRAVEGRPLTEQPARR